MEHYISEESLQKLKESMKVMNPISTTLVALIGLYAIALGSCLYIWQKARKNDNFIAIYTARQ